MKLNYDLLKNILTVMEGEDSHLIQSDVLAKALSFDLSNDDDFDRFSGHIKLLYDYGCIDSKNPDLGFMQTYSGWVYASVNYRLTSRGYEFLDILNEPRVFDKIKNLSISTAWDVGKALLTSVLVAKLGGA